jgi:repressor LexA
MADKCSRMLAFIQDFTCDKGYAPTVGEIQKACGISSKSVVHYNLEALERQGQIKRDARIARGIQVANLADRGRTVPLLGTIAAGEPIPVPSEDSWHPGIVDFVSVPTELLPGKTQAYALKVKGTSMIDALVDDGDIVILRAANTADDGDMVAAWLTDREEATLKRLYHDEGKIRLQPANRTMKPIYVDPDKIQVQGKVVAVLRKVD